jgi:hypothetical protein
MLDRLATQWWFGHAALLLVSASIVLLAILITPSSEMLSLFGVEIPVMCSFRSMFGMPCPGCGLTRSFVFLAHGRPLEGLFMNPMGPFLFAIVAFQLPYRLWRLRAGPPLRRPRAQRDLPPEVQP